MGRRKGGMGKSKGEKGKGETSGRGKRKSGEQKFWLRPCLLL